LQLSNSQDAKKTGKAEGFYIRDGILLNCLMASVLWAIYIVIIQICKTNVQSIIEIIEIKGKKLGE
jgi:hypothetical protein